MKAKFTQSFYGIIVIICFLLYALPGAAQGGYALSFVKTSSQYVSVPHSSSINLGATFTMEAFVNYTGSNSTIIDKGDYDFLWSLDANTNGGKMGFSNKSLNSWVYSTGTVPVGIQTHVAITLSGGILTFYINGVASGSAPVPFSQDNGEMNIGRQQPSGCKCNFFSGMMDEVRLWNVLRTPAQIQANMTIPVAPNSPGLVAYYKFDEGTGITTADATGNGNTGTLINGPSWLPSSLQYAVPGSYSYTVPAGVHSISIKLWGGGGAAGHNCTLYSGGGGAFVQSKPISVTPGQVFTVTVGKGGYASTLSGEESSISLGGNKLVAALGGSMRYGAGPSTGPYVDYSYGGGNAGTNVILIEYGYEDNFYGGGGASGGTGGTGGNGANGSTTVYAAGGLAVGEGGNGGKAGRTNSCSTYTNPPFGSAGSSPGGGGGAPFVNGLGTGGMGRVSISQCFNPGTIIGHTVPFPYELIIDSVYNQNIGSEQAAPYSWQQSTNNTVWTTAPGGVTTRSFPLQVDNPPDEIYYRRNETGCRVSSNSVKIKTFSQANGKLDGSISGKVTSTFGAGVSGITITAKKTIMLLGSPVSHTYSTVTSGDGRYELLNLYYGDLNNGDPASVVFNVIPSKPGHTFNVQNSIDTFSAVSLANNAHEKVNIDFIDNTVYAVSGKVTQTCAGCVPGFTTDDVDSVKLLATKPPSPIPFTSSYSGDNGAGKYAVTVTDPGIYKIIPSYLNNSFSPADSTITIINGDVTNVNFVNNTTRIISGVFKAGNNETIGTAILEFSDTVKGKTTRFKKQVITAADGSYSISLPARRYKVRVVSFSPNVAGSDIPPGDLFTFFNTITKDSTITNIDSTNKILDLIYHRTPVLQVVSLPDTTCGPYIVFKQGKERSFTVNVWEGDPIHNFKIVSPLADSTRLALVTSVQADDIPDSLYYLVANGVSSISLLPGYPNLVAPYYKMFNLTFKDKYGRSAVPINRNAVVLGVKNDPGTFTTVSPEIPLLVLHDPPGDQSISFWEQNKTTETAMRFSTLSNESFNGWLEAKLGVSLLLGFGVSYQTQIWGSLNFNMGVSTTINEAQEAIITTTNSQYYSTADGNIIGDEGDVYIGAALNLLYAVGHELKFTSACTLGIENRLMIGEKDFATTYTYSESHIVNNVIPNLQFLADNTSDPQKADYLNQMKVWQQVVKNNADNKAKAVFDKNISFDGNVGSQTSSTSSTATNSNTIEFNVEINQAIAVELGLEIAGSGIKGGVNIAMKTETGKSKTTTNSTQTTIGYTIDDDDPGDYFTVDVKKDPVYSTPVFSLVAGTASCPQEPVAQKRDVCQLLIPVPVKNNIPAANEALFELHLSNTSESREERTYLLSFVQGSNPNGAIVTIGGSPVITPVQYTIPYLGNQVITVSVRKSQASQVFSYEGLKFMATDFCDGGLSKTATISAYFTSPCSSVLLSAPADNWRINSINNNNLAVEFSGYTLPNLQTVSLEHTTSGSSAWITDTTVFQGQIENASSTTVNWNTTNLPDGAYDLRFKLVCASGTVYSQRVTGIVDRTAPVVFGTPDPTDDNYVTGDIIAYTYNENIDNSNLANKIELRRMSNNVLIPLQASGFQNKVVIVPSSNISGFTGDTMRLIMTGVADVYGNSKQQADTTYFAVGLTVPGAGSTVLNLTSNRRTMFENAFDSLEVRFTLPAPAAVNTQVNYTITGTANHLSDYTVRYPAGQPASTSFNGTQGNITILKNTTTAVLRIKAVGESLFESNETITVSVAEGGGYLLGSVLSMTDTIKNDDHTPPVVFKNGPINLCLGQTLTLSTNNTIDGQPVYAYSWSNGSTDQQLNVTTAGIYILTVYTIDGFSGVSEPVNVTISNLSKPSLGPDVNVTHTCFGETTNLTTLFNTGNLTPSWNTATPTAAPPGNYRLVAANAANCTDTAFAVINLDVATWTGAISTDWHVAGNWNSAQVPTITTHVIIPTGTVRICIISSADAVASSVQLRNGATLQTKNNKVITINGKCQSLAPLH
ncbi:MAG: LamG-like jellyroll fold domain-containing protein [Bacteroidota bacterium]